MVRASKVFPCTCTAYHDNIGFLYLYVVFSSFVQKTFVVVVDGYCQMFFSFILANYILVQKVFDLDRFFNFYIV